MAKGRVKSKKAAKTTATTAAAVAAAAATVKHIAGFPSLNDAKAGEEDDYLTSHHENGEIVCDHRNLNSEKMQKVADLIKELFTTSFRLALPSLYRGLIQNLQDQVLKEKVLSFLDAGIVPSLIKDMAKDESTRQGISVQIQMACEQELPKVVLRLSTEDCFDLTCDLAVRHGRNLKIDGPPCACFFSYCLGCLEKLVKHVCTNPPSVPPIRPIDRQGLVQSMLDILGDEESASCDGWKLGQRMVKDEAWIEQIGDAWQLMADVLWETADKVDPMQLPRVKQQLDSMTRLDGMQLWYNTLIRELEPSRTLQPSKADSISRTWMSYLAAEYKKGLITPSSAQSKKGRGNTDEAETIKDIPGTRLRKSIARALRDIGNAAYSKSLYQEASEHYTKAMSYDGDEAVYSLNRAACMVKMSRYAEAENDCTTSIAIDSTNHKAFFRRGVSRSHLGDIQGAISDFRRVLSIQRDDESTYTDLRTMALDTLRDGIIKDLQRGGPEYSLRELEACLPTHQELVSQLEAYSEEQDSDYASDCSLAESPSPPSVSEVFSQVSFAIAFSHVLKQHTGIDIKVPVACRSSAP